jgi:hypothetical protein
LGFLAAENAGNQFTDHFLRAERKNDCVKIEDSTAK